MAGTDFGAGGFRKRFLSSPLQALRYLFRSNVAIFSLVFSRKEHRISGAFRERLNLAVCSVNECLYCTHLHTKIALAAGVTGAQAAAILAGDMEAVPREEARAVAFARYWADAGGWDDTDGYPALVESYGPGRAATIRAALHVIQAGNMCSNTAEAFRSGARAPNRIAFFFAWTLAAPVALLVRIMGGYRR